MIYSIKTNDMEVSIESFGAELLSIKYKGIEYMWQGDPKYWKSHSVTIFPVCGRLYKGIYKYQGREYSFKNHGLARYYEFKIESISESKMVFLLKSNDETRKQYPFDFELRAIYEIKDNELIVRNEVTSLDEKELIHSFGAHPGFNVPLESGLEFEDYQIDFGDLRSIDAVVYSKDVFLTGEYREIELENGKLNLKHDLFDNDAIFVKEAFDSLTLSSSKGERSLTIKCPTAWHYGLWHSPKTDAPYICIEPWESLPSYEGIVDDLETKPRMRRINKNEVSTFEYSIIVK